MDEKEIVGDKTIKNHSFKHKDVVMCICFTNDGRKYMISCDKFTIYVIDLATKSIVKQWKAHSNWIWWLCIDNKNNTIISGSYDKTIKIWNINTCKLSYQINTDDYVFGICVRNDGKWIISKHYDGTIEETMDLKKKLHENTS